MKTVITSKSLDSFVGKIVVEQFQDYAKTNRLGDDDAVLYFGFPKFQGYEEVTPSPDLIFLSRSHGILAIRFYSADENSLDFDEIEEELEELHSVIFSKLYESKHLRIKKKRKQSLKFELGAYAFSGLAQITEEYEDILFNCFENISNYLSEETLNDPLTEFEFNECRSILEGTKALTSSDQRELKKGDTSSKAFILTKLEEEIKNFDFDQRASAISIIDGPQRIRGLAGSGKTVVLAMKAAHIHLTEPNKKILLTFYTKSLYGHVKNLITRFYRHFKKVDPDWSMLNIKHAWGGSGVDGVYYSSCVDNGIQTIRFKEAKEARPSNPFDYVCAQSLLPSNNIKAVYDYVLIDEAQDMPVNFFKLIYRLTKGERDFKNIIWGYDELQNIFKVKTRSPKELFGVDVDGEDCIDLDRASRHLPRYLENDIILKKCYRNPLDILVSAHALGFGVYNERIPVQGLEGREHWEDLGYIVNSGDFSVGSDVVVERPEKNSPLSILKYEDKSKLINHYRARSMVDEADWVVENISALISEGLKPEDIMVIALDDRRARKYFSDITDKLLLEDISANNILLNPYGSKSFIRKDFVTLSTIHRAKGNEAAAILVIGIDALYWERNSRFGRNKIFTAFTRAKAWLRVSGVGSQAQYFFDEIDRAISKLPFIEFVQHDPEEIETLQRDLSDQKKALKQLRDQMEEQMDLLNVSEEDKKSFFEGKI